MLFQFVCFQGVRPSKSRRGNIRRLGQLYFYFMSRIQTGQASCAVLLRPLLGKIALVLGALILAGKAYAGGAWTPCPPAPDTLRNLLLLSDGTVMAATDPANGFGNQWYRLTPDQHGSYANGTWSAMASMHDTRLAYSSAVLRDGRVFVAGGEYGTGTANAEVYDPLTDVWTMAPPSGQSFLDSICKITAGGDVLVAPVFPNICGRTVLYHPDQNTWSAGPVELNACYQDEASWVKLPDGSILTVDPFGTNTERYIPALNQWVNDAVVPVALYAAGELGAALLLPDGRALFLGGSGHTAFYTPSGDVRPGSWTAGPDIPNGQGTSDAPAAMMVNGKVFCVVGPAGVPDGPAAFYEFDPVSNSFQGVNGPTGLTDNVLPQEISLLDLPDGTVLYSDDSNALYVYQPDGAALATAKPTITGLSTNADGSYHLSGVQLNGISEGAAFGDDLQMDSNYPLVRLTDGQGNVFYARTYNWSSTGVMTGNSAQTTEFALPWGLPAGSYSLVAVVNGVSSDPVSFNVDAMQVTPASGFNATGSRGGPFVPGSTQFQLTNTSSQTLSWSLATTSAWVTASPSSGTLAPAAASPAITVALNTAANALDVGTVRAQVWFTNLSSGISLQREVVLTLKPGAELQPYFNIVQLLNPVAYWRLDETNQPMMGGVATNLGSLGDSANGSFDGVLAWISGPLASAAGNATSFEGISSVTVPYQAALSLRPPFTVEAWIQPSTVQTAGNVVCPLACGHFDTSRSGWLLYQTDTGWDFRMYNQNQLNTSLDLEGGTPPVSGVWSHVCAVYDGTQAAVYVNGVGTSGTPSGFVANTDGPMTVGTRSDAAFGFPGAVGEVAVYTNALPPAAILAHYQLGTNTAIQGSMYAQSVQTNHPLVYLHLDAPSIMPAALNQGTLGAKAQGYYQLGCVPGLNGGPLPGFGGENHACQFNGAAGYLNVPGKALNFTNALSVLAWVQPSPANGLAECVLGKGADSYRLELDGQGVPQFVVGSSNAPAKGALRLDDGHWHQLVGTYDGLGTQSLYVDGAVAATIAAATPPKGTPADLRLGGAPDAGTLRNFGGLIDEAALFTNALTAAQVQLLYFAATNSSALSPSPFSLSTSITSDGSALCNWNVAPGLRYQLQSATNLANPVWANVGPFFTATNATASVSTPTASQSQRFFRILLLP